MDWSAEPQGPRLKCRAVLMSEDDGDLECDGLQPVTGTHFVHTHTHTTAEGRHYRW
ncbi:hypothetical protein SEA_SHAGRAT_57 [Rhodococcus phage Shagrat]|nr:hypothetical protein SEA_SHAGRAT_57 [Rhodococcus phage Shagrat]